MKKLVLLASVFVIILLLLNNYSPKYDIARVNHTKILKENTVTDTMKNKDTIYQQQVIGTLTTGKYKGSKIELFHKYSASSAFDYKISKPSKIFVKVNKTSNDKLLTGSIKGIKRDTTIILLFFVFIFLMLFIGKRQGLLSLLALASNICIILAAISLYLNTALKNLGFVNVFLIVILLCITSFLLILNGIHKKTFYLIALTLLSIGLTALVVYITMRATNEKGIYYESLEFVTLPPKNMFFVEILLGSVGAVVDIVITIFTSMLEISAKNPNMKIQVLRKSGFEIGKDIMGAMTNILLFVYLVGSIPMILLLLRNGLDISFAFQLNLSLELIRALTGGIAVVISIPLTIYISAWILDKEGISYDDFLGTEFYLISIDAPHWRKTRCKIVFRPLCQYLDPDHYSLPALFQGRSDPTCFDCKHPYQRL